MPDGDNLAPFASQTRPVHLCQAMCRLLSHTPCGHWRPRHCYPADRVRLPTIRQRRLSSPTEISDRSVNLATRTRLPRVACSCGTAGPVRGAGSSVRRSLPSSLSCEPGCFADFALATQSNLWQAALGSKVALSTRTTWARANPSKGVSRTGRPSLFSRQRYMTI